MSNVINPEQEQQNFNRFVIWLGDAEAALSLTLVLADLGRPHQVCEQSADHLLLNYKQECSEFGLAFNFRTETTGMNQPPARS